MSPAPLFDSIADRDRVYRGIGAHVLGFFRDLVGRRNCSEFFMSELGAWVKARVPTAPDSPSRILRELRRQGVLDYEVVDRSKSRYRVTRFSL